MNYVTIETKGTAAAYKLGNALKKLVADAVAAKENDGKITVDEIAAIAMANFQSIVDVVGDVKDLAPEAKEAPVAFARSLIVPLSEVADLFLNKNEN